MLFQRSDIILCRLPMPSTGSTQFKVRPAVVVSNDVNNSRLDDLIVAPCTSNTQRALQATHYLIDGQEIAAAGIRVASVVRCEVLTTISKSQILRTLGHLTSTTMQTIDTCLLEALAIRRQANE